MKILPSLSILIALAGWVLMALAATNLLSGPFEGRTCQTDCVQSYFFGATGLGLAAFAIAFVSLWKPGGKFFTYLGLALSAALCMIFAVLFAIGNL